MKKILVLALAAAMVLSMAACADKPPSGAAPSGSTTPQSVSEPGGEPDAGNSGGDVDGEEEPGGLEENTAQRRDDLLAQTEEEVSMWLDIGPKTFEDPEAARELYCGKVLQVTGRLGNFSGDTLTMEYYDLNLSFDWDVNIILHFSEEDETHLKRTYMGQSVTIVGKTEDSLTEEDGSYFYTMNEVYLLQDTEEFVCILSPGIGSNYDAQVEGMDFPIDVSFLPEEKDIPLGTEVTISGIYLDGQLFDAVIVD